MSIIFIFKVLQILAGVEGAPGTQIYTGQTGTSQIPPALGELVSNTSTSARTDEDIVNLSIYILNYYFFKINIYTNP
jgi:hypothetical protein